MTGFGLVVVSNRGPFSFEQGPDGTMVPKAAGGGLAPSLAGALAGILAGGGEKSLTGRGATGALWVSAGPPGVGPGGDAGSRPVRSPQPGLFLRSVDVPVEMDDGAREVISNGTLWFLFHGLFDRSRRPRLDRHWEVAWEHYVAFNSAFAAAVDDGADEGATVVVNDYHLLLAGELLAARRPDLRTVHFTHTPFCPPEDLVLLPDHASARLIGAMGSFGACGFHTARWRDAYLRCAAALSLPAAASFVAPLGAETVRLDEVAAGAPCAKRSATLAELVADRALLVRSDRVELSKNLVRGFLAFDQLLDEHPGWRESVVFVARVYPSRETLAEYLAYRNEVEHVVDQVNARWATPGWTPIVLDLDDDFAATVAAFQRYDVLLVNPVRDGLNLVAKEGPAINERDGVLVLSREAGAFAELGDEAVGINPFDLGSTAAALHEALSMAPAERKARAEVLRAKARAQPPSGWLARLLAEARPSASPPRRPRSDAPAR